ncbi:B12-binding domain-containing radical SAM protein [Tautonia plasticadhaerens]|uniref:Ribosomal protein S12 methylthiotransferase RimO n=1 Tax=Tautonia plasticadhaerens TaxID=2527974 RepID=A0A518GWZ5_9BACT|nr:radical SAM protein [Tautonia plasticadhaerens]QDV33103.1 Ribosomal protein S12 methylthiotransferase RimO [Tautonia plasticadhaerens]
MADIVLINPKFEISYWGLEHALPLMGKKANLPVAALPLLAALTPEGHSVTVVDENVEPIDFDRCARADLVGLTGMSVQRFRMTQILTELKKRGCFTAVGGPYVTVQEDYFEGLADVIFVGEAEQTWPQFLEAWPQGLHQYRYEQSEKTDMSTVPTPRFDLMKSDRYAFGSVQFSRGCPFQCEFCDIIVTFGRRPRIKTAEQVIAELEAVRRSGLKVVFVVDDNLIGNKKGIKPILQAVVDWQQANAYPLTFFTEASLDLADDAELMDLMVEANITFVFVGIETPNEEALRETKKLQNLRKGGTMIEKIHRIQDAGMGVWCGMIMGFDSDDETIFDAQRQFLHEARITTSMTGMLHAIPKTPLYDRLLAEGRLDLDDRPAYGTNVIPLKLSRQELRDGYVRVMNELYEPEAYFERMEDLFLKGNLNIGRGRLRWWRTRPHLRAKTELMWLLQSIGLFIRLMTSVPDPALRREYRRRMWRYLKKRQNPGMAVTYLLHITMHYHAYTLARSLRGATKGTEGATADREPMLINSF